MRRFHNYIKRKFINKHKGSTVLDLACGKGGDLQKYLDSGYRNIQGYDNDIPSIQEANRRKQFFLKENPGAIISLDHADLLTQRIKLNYSVDLIVCNFAFHYFFKEPECILSSILNNSKRGTILLLTLLEESLVKETDTKNLKITRIDNESICVYIKDSVLDKPRIEYLVSKEKLQKLLASIGFDLVQTCNFAEFYPEWLEFPKGRSLSYNEKKYSFMNNAYVFKKS